MHGRPLVAVAGGPTAGQGSIAGDWRPAAGGLLHDCGQPAGSHQQTAASGRGPEARAGDRLGGQGPVARAGAGGPGAGGRRPLDIVFLLIDYG